MKKIKFLPAIQSVKYFIPDYNPDNSDYDIKITSCKNSECVIKQYKNGDILNIGTKQEWELSQVDIVDAVAAGLVARGWAEYV